MVLKEIWTWDIIPPVFQRDKHFILILRNLQENDQKRNENLVDREGKNPTLKKGQF